MSNQNYNFITAQKFAPNNPTYNGNITLLPSGSAYNNVPGYDNIPITNIIINNTLRIPLTQQGEITPTGDTLQPYIGLKDKSTGHFTTIEIDDGSTYVGGVELIRTDDLQNIINDAPIIFSNIYVDAFNQGNSYINFVTNDSNSIAAPQIGLRVSNGFIEYLHKGEDWAPIGSTTETFPTKIYLVTPGALTQYIPIPTDCAGARIKLVGGGGWGGNAAVNIFSQGAGGGSGGHVNCFLTEDDLLNCANIKVNFQPSIAPYGSNVELQIMRINGSLISVANATGGLPGSSVTSPLINSVDGGNGGNGIYTYTAANQGYIIPGGIGGTGFWSESQNLRYYSSGIGAASQLGVGGVGASTSSAPGIAYYGGGGGGGLFIEQGMFNPPSYTIPATNIHYSGGAGGSPAVLIEFWVNSMPWSSSNSGGGGGTITSYFKNLIDVNVGNIADNKYLKYINELVVNQGLNIIDDLTPGLGGNLALNGYNLCFPDSVSGLVDGSGNLAVAVSNANSNICYLVLKAGEMLNGEPAGEITVDSQLGINDPDVSMAINSKGNGDIQISAGSNGVIQLKSGQLSIDDTALVEITSGHLTLATTYLADVDLSINNNVPTVYDAAHISSFLVIECSVSDQRYYLDITAGAPGQILNVIYDSVASNTEVRLGFCGNVNGPFIQKDVGIGSGVVPALKFAVSGQSCQLVYIGMNANPSRSRWQVLNSGAFTCN